MKKIILTLVISVSSLVLKAQEKYYSYTDGTFTITIENGLDIKKQVSFSLSEKDIEKIKETENFKINKEDDVIKYVWSNTISAVYRAKYQLTHINSFDFIDDNKGMIYVTDDGKLNISYKFKAQNGFGNYIYSTCYYTAYAKRGKEKIECNIY